MTLPDTQLKSKPKIAIAIVAYKSADDLLKCIPSIFKSTYNNFDVYILENASGEKEKLELYCKSFSRVKLLVSNINKGFAGGNNILINEILKNKNNYDAIFFLNPDTIIDEKCLEKLANIYDNKTIVQPLVLTYNQNEKLNKVNTWGNPLHFLGFSYAGGNGQNKSNSPKNITNIPLASGCALLIPTTIIKNIGTFKEEYFMYHEDSELCFRARLAGYNIILQPDSIVWHKYSFSRNPNKFYYVERNRLAFIFTSYQIRTLLLVSPFLLITELMLTIYSAINGWFPQKIKASLNLIENIPQICNQRRNTQLIRKIPDKSLYQFFSANLKFNEVDGILIKAYNVFSKAYWIIIKNV